MMRPFRVVQVALLIMMLLVPAHVVQGQEADRSEFEAVLVPVFFFGEGARGSRWESKAVVYNDGDEIVEFARRALNGDPVCDAICGCGLRDEILPDETNEICQGLSSFAGVLIYPPRLQADALFYELTVRDRSRDSKSAGTEIPVIRERDLMEKVVLLDVPAGGPFRTAVRVFDSEGRGGVQVRMQVFAVGMAEPVFDGPVNLIQPVQYLVPEPFPMNPSIAFISDFLDFITPPDEGPDEVDGPDEPGTIRRFRIELTPLPPLERFWAFASVTSDETNEVTTITP